MRHMLNPNQFGYDGSSHPTMESQTLLKKVGKTWKDEHPFSPLQRNPVERYNVPIDKTAEKDKGLLSDHYETDDAPTRPRQVMPRWVSPN